MALGAGAVDYLNLALTVLGLAISLAAYRFARRQNRKLLAYEVLSHTPMLDIMTSIVGKRIQINFDGKPVNDISRIVLNIRNSGNKALREEDYIKPITLSFGKAEILDTKILNTTPSSIEPNLKYTSYLINIAPDLLDQGDSILVEVILTGFSNVVDLSVRVEGMPRILNIKRASVYPNLCQFIGASGVLCILGVQALVYSRDVGEHVISLLAGTVLALSIGAFMANMFMWPFLYKKGVRFQRSDLRGCLPIGEVDNMELPVLLFGAFCSLFAIYECLTFFIQPSSSIIR